MTRPLLAALALVTATCHAKPLKKFTASSPSDFLIVPGTSVGKVRLGATRIAIRRLLGPPSVSFQRTSLYHLDVWQGTKMDKTGDTRHRLTVLYQGNQSVQIEITSPAFHARNGISTRSTLAQFRKFYQPRLRSYHFSAPGGDPFDEDIFDDVKQGLAFIVETSEGYTDLIVPETLRVHRPDFAVIPDDGGDPVDPHNAISARKKSR